MPFNINRTFRDKRDLENFFNQNLLKITKKLAGISQRPEMDVKDKDEDGLNYPITLEHLLLERPNAQSHYSKSDMIFIANLVECLSSSPIGIMLNIEGENKMISLLKNVKEHIDTAFSNTKDVEKEAICQEALSKLALCKKEYKDYANTMRQLVDYVEQKTQGENRQQSGEYTQRVERLLIALLMATVFRAGSDKLASNNQPLPYDKKVMDLLQEHLTERLLYERQQSSAMAQHGVFAPNQQSEKASKVVDSAQQKTIQNKR